MGLPPVHLTKHGWFGTVQYPAHHAQIILARLKIAFWVRTLWGVLLHMTRRRVIWVSGFCSVLMFWNHMHPQTGLKILPMRKICTRMHRDSNWDQNDQNVISKLEKAQKAWTMRRGFD